MYVHPTSRIVFTMTSLLPSCFFTHTKTLYASRLFQIITENNIFPVTDNATCSLPIFHQSAPSPNLCHWNPRVYRFSVDVNHTQHKQYNTVLHCQNINLAMRLHRRHYRPHRCLHWSHAGNIQTTIS